MIAYSQKFKQLSLDSDKSLMLEQYYPLDLVLGKRGKIVLPPSLYGQAIFAAHDAKTAGHFTLQSMLMRIRSVFTFCNINQR